MLTAICFHAFQVLVNDFEEASSIDMKEAQSDMDASVEKLGKLYMTTWMSQELSTWLVNGL